MTAGGWTPTRAGVPTSRPSEPTSSRRDDARAAVGDRGLASAAIEIVVRQSMGRVPPSMVDRARVLLRRFFSAAAWRIDDDAALAAIVGPGSGVARVALDDDLTIVVAFRASSLRIDVELADPESAHDTGSNGNGPRAIDRTADEPPDQTADAIVLSFDRPLVPEAGPNARVVRFLTGPGTGGSGGWIRDAATTTDDRVARVLRTFVDLTGVLLGTGFVAVEIVAEDRWDDLLLPIMTCVEGAFVAERPPRPPDRQLERARLEFAGVNPDSARGIGKVRDALTSPDAAVRQLAVELIEHDTLSSAEKAWKVALDDSSRAVRRAAIVTMAGAEREELRSLLERGVGESDACARYHAVVGLGRIGVERSRSVLERCLTDGDARVRLAARKVL